MPMPPSPTDTPAWSLRRAVAADAGALAALMKAAYATYIAKLGDSLPVAGDHAVEIAEQRVWVASADDQIVGSLVLQPRDDHMVLENVAVHPDHQGTGLGRALIDHAEATARGHGHLEIRLFTHRDMPENVARYERLGWVKLTPVPGSMKVAMVKRLG